jgi:hypothetical protein
MTPPPPPPYPHPYIMDSEKVDLKLNMPLLQNTEKLKAMIREFSSFHVLCHEAQAFLSCNIDRIVTGEKPFNWPKINIPGNCPDPIEPQE